MQLDSAEIIVIGLGVLISALAYLLKRKDEEQADLIKELFHKHTEDADRLHVVELKIASDHYQKAELDSKFDKIELMMQHGFETLGSKFDVVSSSWVAHIAKEESGKNP